MFEQKNNAAVFYFVAQSKYFDFAKPAQLQAGSAVAERGIYAASTSFGTAVRKRHEPLHNKGFVMAKPRQQPLPLPKGEGWGEGKEALQIQKSPKFRIRAHGEVHHLTIQSYENHSR